MNAEALWPDVAAEARAFGARPDISARSTLITIFGDAVVPAGGEIWLGDLIDLCEPFGFNERLVRTSMFRLAAEGWFDVDRVGRRSRYRLTSKATEEFAESYARIYGVPDGNWDGRWTLVMLDPNLLDRDNAERVRSSLEWNGYLSLARGVLGVPRDESAHAARLIERTGTGVTVPIATAKFADVEALVAGGWLNQSLDLADTVARYGVFLSRYRRVASKSLQDLHDREAFLLRTMLVHDLRRLRLASADLPDELLPDGWPAGDAVSLAALIYAEVLDGSNRWLGTVVGVAPDTSTQRWAFRPEWPGGGDSVL